MKHLSNLDAPKDCLGSALCFLFLFFFFPPLKKRLSEVDTPGAECLSARCVDLQIKVQHLTWRSRREEKKESDICRMCVVFFATERTNLCLLSVTVSLKQPFCIR